MNETDYDPVFGAMSRRLANEIDRDILVKIGLECEGVWYKIDRMQALEELMCRFHLSASNAFSILDEIIAQEKHEIMTSWSVEPDQDLKCYSEITLDECGKQY